VWCVYLWHGAEWQKLDSGGGMASSQLPMPTPTCSGCRRRRFFMFFYSFLYIYIIMCVLDPAPATLVCSTLSTPFE